MANNELIYVVKFQADMESLKQVQKEAAAAGAGSSAKGGGSSAKTAVKDVKELTEAEARLRVEQQARTKATLDGARAQLAQERAAKLTGRTYQELVDINKALNIQLKELDFEKDAAKIGTLQAAYKKNNDALKAFDQNLGNNQRNVGNYKDSIIEALGGLNAFGQPVALATRGIMDQAKAFTEARKGAGGMKEAFAGLNATMKANVIFAAISAIVGLTNAFMTFQPIADAVKSVFAGISGAVSGLIKALTTGGNIFTEMSAGAKAAAALNTSLNTTYELETNLIKVRSENQEIIAKNREASKDENKSLVVRISLLKNATDKQNEIEKAEKAVLERKVQEAKIQAGLDQNSRESLRAVAEAEAALNESRVRNANARKEIAENTNTLTRQERDEIAQTTTLELQSADSIAKKVNLQLDRRRASFTELKKQTALEKLQTDELLRARADAEKQAVQDSTDSATLKAAKIQAIDDQLNLALQQNAIETAEKKRQLDEAEFTSKVELAGMTASAVSSISMGLQAVGLLSAKRAFQIGKAADAAQATTAGILATQRALAVAPAPNFLLAGLTAAVAAGNVAKILATPFGGRGGASLNTPRGSGASAPSASGAPTGISIQSVASQVGASVTGGPAAQRSVFVVQNNIDRAGIATLVQEGNNELSSRGLAVSSV